MNSIRVRVRSQTIAVATTDDGIYGTASAPVTVTLVSASDNASATGSATTTLIDGEAPGSYAITADQASATEGQAAGFTIHRSGAAAATAETVTYTVDGGATPQRSEERRGGKECR